MNTGKAGLPFPFGQDFAPEGNLPGKAAHAIPISCPALAGEPGGRPTRDAFEERARPVRRDGGS